MNQVIVNPQSGLAESHDPAAASELLQRGYHLPLHDDQGNAFSAPHAQASELINTGQYRQPSPEELGSWLEHAHYNSPQQKALAFIEGGTRGVSGPLAPILEEQFLGVPKEEQLKRKEYNPGTALSGEVASMAAATMMTSGFFGAAKAGAGIPFLPNLISKAATAATEGIAVEGTFGNIAKHAATAAIEGGLFAAQNEITENVLGDTNNLSQHVLADVGLSALLAGGAGGIIAGVGGPFSALSKKLGKASEFIKETATKQAKTGETVAPDMVSQLGEPLMARQVSKNSMGLPKSLNSELFEHVPAMGPVPMETVEAAGPYPLKTPFLADQGAGLISKIRDQMDLGISDVMGLLKNPYGFGAYKLGKLIEKVTAKQIVNTFSDQAPKVISVLESFKKGLDSVAKIENKTASLFGYATSTAITSDESLLKLHSLYDDSHAIEQDPTILIDRMQKHTEPMANNMPDTTIALTHNVANALNLLKMAKPKLQKAAPLDRDPVPNQSQIANFNKIAHTLNNPLSVLDHIKSGTLSNDHMAVMKMAYPAVLQTMQKEALKNIMKHQSENKGNIDYKTRMGLSRLLGQPLDSSMLLIGKNQLALGGMPPPQPIPQGTGTKSSKSGISKMKSATREQTRAQQSVERT